MKYLKTFENLFDNITNDEHSYEEMMSADIRAMIDEMQSEFVDMQANDISFGVDDNIVNIGFDYYDAGIGTDINIKWDVNQQTATLKITITDENLTELEVDESEIQVGSVKTLIQELDKAAGKSIEIDGNYRQS